MNILALETSTEACSAAILRADGEIFARFEVAPRAHNHLLPRMIGEVLAGADIERGDLTHCAFGNGPGAFTGIRIAAAQAQGIGIGLGVPLVAVSTLAVLAQVACQRLDGNTVLAALDARMGEIYWAIYRRDGAGIARLQGRELLGGAETVNSDISVDIGVGHGWRCGPGAVASVIRDDLLPDARALLVLAQSAIGEGLAVEAQAAGINYLRNHVADKPRPGV